MKQVDDFCIPVDLTNPGQVFACLGFMEAANMLYGQDGHVACGFDWQGELGGENARFRLRAAGGKNPFGDVLGFLAKAKVSMVVPSAPLYNTDEDKIPSESDVFPFPAPDNFRTLPVCLEDADGRRLMIDYYGDKTRRDNMKFWAGQVSGVRLTRGAMDLFREILRDAGLDQAATDPFSLHAAQKSSFRLDPRGGYNPMDIGFSLNQHGGDIKMQGYPVVELMASLGLTNARASRREKLEYAYGVAGVLGPNSDLYDPLFLRAALGAEFPPFPGMPFRLFIMRLDLPGKKAKSRCITEVFEEY